MQLKEEIRSLKSYIFDLEQMCPKIQFKQTKSLFDENELIERLQKQDLSQTELKAFMKVYGPDADREKYV